MRGYVQAVGRQTENFATVVAPDLPSSHSPEIRMIAPMLWRVDETVTDGFLRIVPGVRRIFLFSIGTNDEPFHA